MWKTLRLGLICSKLKLILFPDLSVRNKKWFTPQFGSNHSRMLSVEFTKMSLLCKTMFVMVVTIHQYEYIVYIFCMLCCISNMNRSALQILFIGDMYEQYISYIYKFISTNVPGIKNKFDSLSSFYSNCSTT